MKRLIITLLSMMTACSLFGQNREIMYEEFKVAVNKKDTTAMLSVISNWEKNFPDDAELYSLRANYHMSNAIEEQIGLSYQKPTDGRDYYVMTDSLGVNYYMYPELQIDSVKFNSAILSLVEGINRNPDRADLRLGKITVHLMAHDNKAAIDEIQAMLKHSKNNGNNWTTTLDVPIEGDGYSYILDCVKDYFGQIVNSEDLTSAEKLSDICLEEYPNEPVFLSNKGVMRYYAGDGNAALDYFLKAREIDPKDMLITLNIAFMYEQQGDIQNAIKYYEIVAASGEEDYTLIANSALKELQMQQ
ncbi:MAG: tetratricopeptide repeat protein, partial [Candidatus Cryptobacteroides sp.]